MKTLRESIVFMAVMVLIAAIALVAFRKWDTSTTSTTFATSAARRNYRWYSMTAWCSVIDAGLQWRALSNGGMMTNYREQRTSWLNRHERDLLLLRRRGRLWRRRQRVLHWLLWGFLRRRNELRTKKGRIEKQTRLRAGELAKYRGPASIIIMTDSPLVTYSLRKIPASRSNRKCICTHKEGEHYSDISTGGKAKKCMRKGCECLLFCWKIPKKDRMRKSGHPINQSNMNEKLLEWHWVIQKRNRH